MKKDRLKKRILQAIEDTPSKDVIKTISLFGSYLHGDNTKESDVDLLLTLHKPIGFFALIGIQELLEQKLGKKVDIRTAKDLHHSFRNKVVNESEKVYG